jgi:antitoxin (DNA-binding transcriptional repressor) of toxin-antitoxin stability system
MKASFVDLRTKSSEILQALNRNEPVTIQYRGRTKAIMQPVNEQSAPPCKARQHAAFGLWQGRAEAEDVAEMMRTLRRGRFDAR